VGSQRSTPKWNELREALWCRSDGLCEVSGLPLDFDTFDAHHRRPKQMGGTYRPDTDTLPNLIALHPIVHNGNPASVHQAPSWSRPRGYLLHANVDVLETMPMLYRGRHWVVLMPDGTLCVPEGSSQAYLHRQLAAADVANLAVMSTDQQRRKLGYGHSSRGRSQYR
jgi:hypothetical protein